MKKIVGILALQGAYHKHSDMLSRLKVESRFIRKPDELNSCAGLIIPGGESTTISLLIQEYGLHEPIKKFADEHPVMGVCAGLIMMATDVDDERIKPLGLIPFKALRNHYGRQVCSVTAEIELRFDDSPFYAPLIRAPGIKNLSVDTEVLATYEDDPVMIKNNNHIALSFHPELTDDTRIHQYWLRDL